MAEAVQTYSEVTKKQLRPSEEDILAKKIQKLKQDIPDPLRNGLEEIVQSFKQIQLQHEQDKQKQQKEINQLKIRVSNLQRQIEKLQQIDAIDAGEAMKIMEIHVASFVLPPTKEIASVGAFDQMFEYTKKNKSDTRWTYLQNRVNMKWSDKHLKVKEDLIKYRNIHAHHHKFDLAQLKSAMIKRMPHREQQCKDLVVLFERVDSLIKFAVITSESVVRDIAQKKLRKEHIMDLINKIETECYRDVQYLQDITIEKAKEHLAQYIPERTRLIWDLTEVIKKTNGPRLGNVVEQTEKEIVAKILQNPAIRSFNDLDKYITSGKSGSDKANWQWNYLTDGKAWSKEHNEAITELKNLSNGRCGTVSPLPLNIAQLHIPDFLSQTLWEAGSDIIEIFTRWQKIY